MVQQGQSLPLGLESGYYTLGIHPWLNNFQGYAAYDRVLLLGQVHNPHSAFPQDTEQLVASDLTAMLLDERIQGRSWGGCVLILRFSQSMENQPVQAIRPSAEYRGVVFHFIYQSYFQGATQPLLHGKQQQPHRYIRKKALLRAFFFKEFENFSKLGVNRFTGIHRLAHVPVQHALEKPLDCLEHVGRLGFIRYVISVADVAQ